MQKIYKDNKNVKQYERAQQTFKSFSSKYEENLLSRQSN